MWGYRTALENPWISQNFRQILMFSHSRYLSGYMCVSPPVFLARLRRSRTTDLFVCFYEPCLNVLEFESFELPICCLVYFILININWYSKRLNYNNSY